MRATPIFSASFPARHFFSLFDLSSRLLLGEHDDINVGINEIARSSENIAYRASERRAQSVLHLHRLEHDDRVALAVASGLRAELQREWQKPQRVHGSLNI